MEPSWHGSSSPRPASGAPGSEPGGEHQRSAAGVCSLARAAQRVGRSCYISIPLHDRTRYAPGPGLCRSRSGRHLPLRLSARTLAALGWAVVHPDRPSRLCWGGRRRVGLLPALPGPDRAAGSPAGRPLPAGRPADQQCRRRRDAHPPAPSRHAAPFPPAGRPDAHRAGSVPDQLLPAGALYRIAVPAAGAGELPGRRSRPLAAGRRSLRAGNAGPLAGRAGGPGAGLAGPGANTRGQTLA